MTNDLALLRLLQLASPTLPVGAYSYSEGLEFLVETGTIGNAQQLKHWLLQELHYGSIRVDTAIMLRAYRAMVAADTEALCYWNSWLSAVRDTEELRSQSWQMGRSLLRLLQDIQPTDVELFPELFQQDQGWNFAIAFGIVAATWTIDLRSAIVGYLHSWMTNLINAGIKLIPLGQTTGQQVLIDLYPSLERAISEILTIHDDELCACSWGLSLASMAHETQYSRLFRS
jgi:urease accessory protein